MAKHNDSEEHRYTIFSKLKLKSGLSGPCESAQTGKQMDNAQWMGGRVGAYMEVCVCARKQVYSR